MQPQTEVIRAIVLEVSPYLPDGLWMGCHACADCNALGGGGGQPCPASLRAFSVSQPPASHLHTARHGDLMHHHRSIGAPALCRMRRQCRSADSCPLTSTAHRYCAQHLCIRLCAACRSTSTVQAAPAVLLTVALPLHCCCSSGAQCWCIMLVHNAGA